jgi:hypothetical protein
MGQLDFSNIDAMSEAEERRFMTAFTNALSQDKGEAAKDHLAAGRPIYYGDDRFKDAVVKEYPDGRRQLVTFQADAEVLLRDL